MTSTQKLLIAIFSIIGVSFTLLGCLTAGTHGSIKAYPFPVSKTVLQNTVTKVIKQELNLRIAPITDTFNSSYYNDGTRYITLEIGDSAAFNEYTFQFTGDQKDWDTAGSSEISIAYAYDKNGNGGSEGNGRFSSCKRSVRHAIVNLFEKEFIDKIDSALQIPNTNANSQ